MDNENDKENIDISPLYQRNYQKPSVKRSPKKSPKKSPLRNRESKSCENNSDAKECSEAKECSTRRGGGRVGGFSRLLTDATNTIRYDLDEKTAIRVQDDDATNLIHEWMSEQRGDQM